MKHQAQENSLEREEEQSSSPPVVSFSSPARRLLIDRLAQFVFVAGGWLIIVAIAAIFVVIAKEALPVFSNASLGEGRQIPITDGTFIAAQTDDKRQIITAISDVGNLQTFGDTNSSLKTTTLPLLSGERVTAAELLNGEVVAGTNLGRLFRGETGAEPSNFQDLTLGTSAVRILSYSKNAEVRHIGALLENGELCVLSISATRSLMGTAKEKVQQHCLSGQVDIRALAFATGGEYLMTGDSAGVIKTFRLTSSELKEVGETIKIAQAPIARLQTLIGGRTLIVSSTDGRLQSLHLRPTQGKVVVTQIQTFLPSDAQSSARFLAASQRNRTFAAVTENGALDLFFSTTGAHLLSTQLTPQNGNLAVAFAPRGDGLLVVSRAGINLYPLTNLYPEVSFRTLFSKVWYEDYPAPAHVWQSSAGNDEFEAKLGLMPLIFGTLKATLYGLVFAVPIAILAAIYVSQFMHPRLQSWVKPVIELMAALPSVVIGFLAGLWLAPRIVTIIPALVVAPIVLPTVFFLGAWLKEFLARRTSFKFRLGFELSLLIPLAVIAVFLCGVIGGRIEVLMFGGDYRAWLSETFAITVNQRNSIVVGIAMGFAIVPIIFTIAEDAISSVPRNLAAASLALGASRWQTAIKVIVPAASSGIFSAIMVGFGRAVGETMIVLMAAGNTPLMDWSIFNGLRALSANIAVELPEAAHGSAHYRLLFFTALLLFVATFIVNSITEVIRSRIRRRYRAL